MREKPNYATIISLLSLFGASCAYGIEFSPTLEIHGYGTLGASMTNATSVAVIDPLSKQVNYAIPLINDIGNKPIFTEDTLGGLRFIATVNDSVSFVTAFLSEGHENYNVATDYLYAQWHANEEWDVQVGHLRLPLYMFSQNIKIGYTYLWSRAPVEFYNFFSLGNFNGLLIRNIEPLPYSWVSQLTVSYGNAFEDDDIFTWTDTEAENTFLAEWILSNDIIKLRAGYAVTSLTATYDASFATFQQVLNNPCGAFNTALAPEIITVAPIGSPGQCMMSLVPTIPFPLPPSLSVLTPDGATANALTSKNASTEFLSFGYDFKWNHFLSTAEWRNIHIDDKILPSQTSWYVLLGFNWEDITFHATYATTRTNNNSGREFFNTISGTYINPFSIIGPTSIPQPETMQTSVNTLLHNYFDMEQHGIDVGIRYDVLSTVALKVDYQYLITDDNTRGLFMTEYGPAAPAKRISWVTAEVNVLF